MHPVQEGTETKQEEKSSNVLKTMVKLPCHQAQVAELVDALVSNTNEVTLVPVRLRPWVHKTPSDANQKGFFYFLANHWITVLKSHFTKSNITIQFIT